ncbi:transcription factor Opi1-domain-containing protein [Lipomyces oligophaga]|uniref:transcription factor Opi1-domain-containing protein n=1 Tax=Lipomyces oligophaga TaxID=45792 RepID=UPI0034CD185A
MTIGESRQRPRAYDERLSIQALCSPSTEYPSPKILPHPVVEDPTTLMTPLSTYASSSTSSTVTLQPYSPVDEDDNRSLCSGLSLDDPDVRLVAEALEDLRSDYSNDHSANFRQSQDIIAQAGRSLLTSSGTSAAQPPAAVSGKSSLVSRMTRSYPIVNSAVRVYESGKSYSRGFRYGAEMVESVAAPVVRRIEPLALRQLDRLEAKSANFGHVRSTMVNPDNSSTVVTAAANASNSEEHARQYQSSRWHNVIANASGLTFSMSEESMKSLRYCLQCLKFANSRLTTTVTRLQELLDEKKCPTPAEQSSLLHRVTDAKKDIVTTIGRVVDIVSTYAGSALPEPARSLARSYMLELPTRWVQVSSSRTTSRRNSLSPSTPGSLTDDGQTLDDFEHSDLAVQEHASRVIVLADEALMMLVRLTSVVNDTLDSAEGWCDRFGRTSGSSEPVMDQSINPIDNPGPNLSDLSDHHPTDADGDAVMKG